jgi:hypothetical protein
MEAKTTGLNRRQFLSGVSVVVIYSTTEWQGIEVATVDATAACLDRRQFFWAVLA